MGFSLRGELASRWKLKNRLHKQVVLGR
jgi:hypothetical protein